MKTVKISTKKPPQWILDAVGEQFNVYWEDGIIFTYDGVISNFRGEMTEDLLAHENNHIKQQSKTTPEEWWKRYLKDDEFRYSQELECYRLQYIWAKNNIKDKEEVFKSLFFYSKSLSSKMYGNIRTFSEAMKDIKQ